MTPNKLKDLIDKVALEAFVKPETCVVTYCTKYGIEIWWTQRKAKTDDPEILATLMLSDLKRKEDEDGSWISTHSCNMRRVTSDVHLNRPIACVYSEFIAYYRSLQLSADDKVLNLIEKVRQDSKIPKTAMDITCAYPKSSFLSESIVSETKLSDDLKDGFVFETNYDRFPIKTWYEVDGVEFDNLKDAQNLKETIVFFEELQKDSPVELDFMEHEALIKTIMENRGKYAALLGTK